jgi:hypothetical protein
MRRKPTTIASVGLALALMISVAGLLGGGSRRDPKAFISGLMGFLPSAETSNMQAGVRRRAPIDQ